MFGKQSCFFILHSYSLLVWVRSRTFTRSFKETPHKTPTHLPHSKKMSTKEQRSENICKTDSGEEPERMSAFVSWRWFSRVDSIVKQLFVAVVKIGRKRACAPIMCVWDGLEGGVYYNGTLEQGDKVATTSNKGLSPRRQLLERRKECDWCTEP